VENPLSIDEATWLVDAALVRWGAAASTASRVAEHLVESEIVGHHSHGLQMLLVYRELIDPGELEISAIPEVTQIDGGIISIDCHQGLGQPAMALAVDEASEAVARTGIAAAAVVRLAIPGGWAPGSSEAHCVAARRLPSLRPRILSSRSPWEV
jgi:LDH2 family malate/lactate/ureidoglycolate dehydrogenase